MKKFVRQTLTMLDRKCIGGNRTPVSRVAGENSTTEPPMRQEFIKTCWRAATNAKKKNEKKCGNVGALYFGGAMERLARVYCSVVELSNADRMVSGSNPDVCCLLGIGVPCK